MGKLNRQRTPTALPKIRSSASTRQRTGTAQSPVRGPRHRFLACETLHYPPENGHGPLEEVL